MVICILESAVSTMGRRQKRFFRHLCKRVMIVTPARYTDGVNVWLVYASNQIDEDDVGNFSAVASNLDTISFNPLSRVADSTKSERDRVLAQLKSERKLKTIDEVVVPRGKLLRKVIQEVNNVPNWLVCDERVPDNLTPISS